MFHKHIFKLPFEMDTKIKLSINEPHDEKNRFLPMLKQRRSSASADQRLCFRYTDSTIPLLLKYETSSFYPSSVSAQAGSCLTWSERPKAVFLGAAAQILISMFQIDELNAQIQRQARSALVCIYSFI